MTNWAAVTQGESRHPFADNQIAAPEWTAREADAIQRHRLDIYANRAKANAERVRREPTLLDRLYGAVQL